MPPTILTCRSLGVSDVELTPYDTGERAQPFVWEHDGDSDRYGMVDFDNDEGATIATVYVARSEIDGSYVMHIEPNNDDLMVIDNREVI